ncbi:MAG: hypothetical protein U0R50_14620 [Gaiellales bacterium]
MGLLSTEERADVARAEPEVAARLSSGSRGGLLVGASALAGIAFNYVFLLGAGRLLGKADYGEFAAIGGLLTVLLIPAGALQMAVSREVSRLVAVGETDRAQAFSVRVVLVTAAATVPLVVGFIAFSGPIASLISIDREGLLAVSGLSLVATLLAPVALGIVQGTQRLGALAIVSFAPFATRVGVLSVAAVARAGGSEALLPRSSSRRSWVSRLRSAPPGAFSRIAACAATCSSSAFSHTSGLS